MMITYRTYIPCVLALMTCCVALAQQPYHQGITVNSVGSSASVVNGIAFSWGGDQDPNIGQASQGYLITGWRSDTLDFGGTLHEPGTGSIFLSSFDMDGNLRWSKVSGSAEQQSDHRGMAVTSSFYEDALFNAGALSSTEPATFDGVSLPLGSLGYVAKYSYDGVLLWIRGFDGPVTAIDFAWGSPYILVDDSRVEVLNEADGSTVASVTGNGDQMNVEYHNMVFEDSSGDLYMNWGDRIAKYDIDLNQVWSTPIVKSPLAESFRISTSYGGRIWGSFYAPSGTVSLGGQTYNDFPNGYIFSLSRVDGSVMSCASPGPHKLKWVGIADDGGLWGLGDTESNTPRLVKYGAQLNMEWNLPTIDVNAFYNTWMGDGCFLLGGQYAMDITLDGTTHQRPNDSGQANAIALGLCMTDLGVSAASASHSIGLRPNPTHSTLMLDLRPEDIIRGTIQILALDGRMALQVPAASTIAIDHLLPGIYVLKLQPESGRSFTARFVKE